MNTELTGDPKYDGASPTRSDESAGSRVPGRLLEKDFLGDRYRLLSQLASGGMGLTFRAWDETSRIPVVVKMPRAEVREDDVCIKRFAREIETMRVVPHPAIVPIIDSGVADGVPYVVMRFLPGGSLADHRQRTQAGAIKPMPPEMLHLWLPGVAAALDHLHRRGVVHRDVKPGNIFLDGFRRPFLGDFGIAKIVSESGGLVKDETVTATKAAVGTLEYMAPELFVHSAVVDGRSDQYALAVTVYDILSGKKPFDGRLGHLIVEHATLPVPSLSERLSSLPESLCEAVHRALSKSPDQRFDSCTGFAVAALKDVGLPDADVGVVRLICPTCRKLLKLPETAAGKSGRCPKCDASLEISPDLAALFLTEERCGGVADSTQAFLSPDVFVEQVGNAGHSKSRLVSSIIALAIGGIVAGMCGGYYLAASRHGGAEGKELEAAQASFARERAQVDRQAEEIKQLELLLSEARRQLVDAEEAISDADEVRRSDLSDMAKALAKAEAAGERQAVEAEVAISRLKEVSLEKFDLCLLLREVLTRVDGTLVLDDVSSLTKDGASALAAYKGTLELNGLKTISVDVAKELAKHDGHGLILNGLQTISLGAAKELVARKGWWLDLKGLKDVPKETLDVLRSNPTVQLPPGLSL